MIIQCMTPCVCVYAQKTCSFVYCEHWIGQREETSSTFLELGQSIEIDRQKDRHIYRQTDRHKHRSTERQIERQKDRQIDRQTDRQIDRQTDRSIDRQTDRQIGRQADRQIDKQTERQIGRQKVFLYSSCITRNYRYSQVVGPALLLFSHHTLVYRILLTIQGGEGKGRIEGGKQEGANIKKTKGFKMLRNWA